jgi:hypothetical protein
MELHIFVSLIDPFGQAKAIGTSIINPFSRDKD